MGAENSTPTESITYNPTATAVNNPVEETVAEIQEVDDLETVENDVDKVFDPNSFFNKVQTNNTYNNVNRSNDSGKRVFLFYRTPSNKENKQFELFK
jgi:hypothetical protein